MSMSPNEGAVTKRALMGSGEEQGLWKPCIHAYKIIYISYIKRSLLNTEAESQGFRPFLFFFFFPPYFLLPVPFTTAQLQQVQTDTISSQC